MAPTASRRPRSSSATNLDAYSSNSDNNTMAPPPAKKPRATSSATPATASTAARPATPRQQGPVVFWFRSKDLRVRDNTALYRAWVQAAQVNAQRAPVVGANPVAPRGPAAHATAQALNGTLLTCFVVCGPQYTMHDYAPAKVDFLLRNLRDLQSRLEAEFQIPLTVLHAASWDEVPKVVAEFVERVGATHLYYNHEYEVHEARRDAAVQALLAPQGAICVGAHDECIVAPGVVKSKENKVYTVYTPFRKAWQDLVKRKHPQDWLAMSPDPGANPATVRTVVPDLFGTTIPEATHEALPGYTLPIDESVLAHTRVAWPAGETAAHDRLKRFAQAKLSAYSVDRDFPSLDGCSSMSGYLTTGVISARACFNVARAANGGQIDTGDKGAVHWMQELVWREFYRHILVAFPRVSMNQPFKLDTKLVKWTDHDPATKDEAERHFTAWCEGKTGYPMVDAAMRMLVQEGYLSNRLRMVAAMFLTKDLLIDWRRGERFFMRHLIDGDLAQNNGGWQWSASTGTDSQPYFRVFNPYLQSEKFDPDAVTIRKYVPELRAVKDSKALHEPHARLPAAVFVRTGYLRPIVDHKAARVRAINAFKIAAGKVV
ncbi:hypothetical protein GGF31_002316 [Allomyces arbusculus]|nr:hypothetical protein GGF31_002316 [Allomyces arbusculus]